MINCSHVTTILTDISDILYHVTTMLIIISDILYHVTTMLTDISDILYHVITTFNCVRVLMSLWIIRTHSLLSGVSCSTKDD